MLLAHVFTFNIKHLFYPVPVILLLIYMSLVMVFFKKIFHKNVFIYAVHLRATATAGWGSGITNPETDWFSY